MTTTAAPAWRPVGACSEVSGALKKFRCASETEGSATLEQHVERRKGDYDDGASLEACEYTSSLCASFNVGTPAARPAHILFKRLETTLEHVCPRACATCFAGLEHFHVHFQQLPGCLPQG